MPEASSGKRVQNPKYGCQFGAPRLPTKTFKRSYVKVGSLLGKRQAESALDAACAVAGLGIDRGITAFERFGIYERRGDGYYVVTPVGRFVVPAVRNSTVDLLADLDRHGWLQRLQTAAAKEASTPFRAAAARLDAALFALTQSPGRTVLQEVRASSAASRPCAQPAQDSRSDPLPGAYVVIRVVRQG